MKYILGKAAIIRTIPNIHIELSDILYVWQM